VLAVQETFIPAGAWLKADGTVDITVGGKVLDGGYGVNMQTAIHALRRYAAQHGPLLMTTLLPDGRSNMDTVHPNGTIKKYDSGSRTVPAGPLGHGSLIPAEDLDFFGLPPLKSGHAPPAGNNRHGRVEAFSDRPVFRPTVHAHAPVRDIHMTRPTDRGLGLQRSTPLHPVAVTRTEITSGRPALSVKAVALERHRVASPIRTLGFLLVTILLAAALVMFGPMILLRTGAWDPLQPWHGAAEPAHQQQSTPH